MAKRSDQDDKIVRADETGARKGAEYLMSGRLVALPTETVYGLGACTRSAGGLDRLRRVKDRSADKPFALMVVSAADALRYVPQAPVLARRLMRKAWPGPLTIVVESAHPLDSPAVERFGPESVAPLFHGDNTIGLRCPADAMVALLLGQTDGPVVAASANRAGQSPALTANEVIQSLGDDVDLVLDGGPVQYGVASTVVQVDADGAWHVLRPGLLEERAIEKMAVETWLFVCTGNTCRSPMAAALAAHRLAARHHVKVDQLPQLGYRILSAGVSAFDGFAASSGAIDAAAELGARIENHRSARLTVDAISQADRILVMTESQRRAVVSLAPAAAGRVRLLAGDQSIQDPVGGGDHVYRDVAAQIDRAVELLVKEDA